MTAQDDRVATFRRLHSSGCFVMPNPWDAGSAKALEQMGFQALATTSAGLAWTLGCPDDQVTLDQTLEHLRVVVVAVAVPVNADFRGGYAVAPEDVKANVRSAVATGIAGLSIEDSSGDEADPLFEFELAVERIPAGTAAIDESGTGVVLTGRSKVSCADAPTSTRRSAGCAPTRRREPTACTLRGSTISITWWPSWGRWRRNP